jgi:Zn-dependent peptidase ImmA (M78 family)
MTRRRDSIEAKAQALLDSFGIQTVPISVEKIAKAMGARLQYSPLDEELSGMIFIKDGIPIIGVNSLHHPNRQRFTVAHELAHLHLHRDHISRNVHVDKRFAESMLRRDAAASTGTEQLEIDANQFAAALLMPKARLEELLAVTQLDIEDEQALEHLAKKFKVSKATLQYRIRNLSSKLAIPARRIRVSTAATE